MVRTRFAPSPTGELHVGGVRTALFAWLIAKQADGEFILRIEDTDKAREVEGSLEQIKESLMWLGLDWQAEYKQSERLELYKEWAQELIDKGLAYADPYSSEEVNDFRRAAQAAKQPFLYRNHRPDNPPAWDGSQPLRFKVADLKRYEWHDEVRGDLSAGEEALDDFIIIKADGYPTYNFAHIIDDHLMEISHVIRGEEFIASMPKYLSVYEALELTPPKFVTVPPILNKNGGKKLSKRDGALSALEYRDQGYLSEGVTNFLVTLGWNDGTEQEIFTPEEILATFSIERIQSGGAKFDDERLVWINGHHIRDLSLDELYGRIDAHFWPEVASSADDDYKKSVLGLVQERLKFFTELPELTTFFFEEPAVDKKLLLKKLDEATAKQYLEAVADELETSDFSEADLEERLRKLVEQLDTKTDVLFRLIRVATTGQETAPGLFETMHVLGQDPVLSRLKKVRL